MLEELIEEGRRLFPWPLRPPAGGELPPAPQSGPADVIEGGLAFAWRWVELPVPFLDPSGQRNDVFPLPLAVFQEPDDCQAKHYVSMSALWYLFPLRVPVSVFFNASRADFWEAMG